MRVREEEEEEEEGPTKSWSRGLLEDEVTGGAGREGGALHDIGREGRSRKRNEAVGEGGKQESVSDLVRGGA